MTNKKKAKLKRLLNNLCKKYFMTVINGTGLGEIEGHGKAAAEYEKALKEILSFTSNLEKW